MLVCGDSAQVPLVDDSVDIIVTSPPYNLQKSYGSGDNLPYSEYLVWARQVGREMARVLRPTGRLCLNVPFDTNLGGKHFVTADWHQALAESAPELLFNTLIVWDKDQVGSRLAWGSFASASDPYITTPTEAVLIYSKQQRKRDKTNKTTLITKDEFKSWTLGLWPIKPESAKRVKHPAPFPIELPRRLLKLYAFQEDTCLDLFSGSGSTGVACRELGVRFVGVDLNLDFLLASRAREI